MNGNVYNYLYETYAGSVAYIEVESSDGISIGSAFYIGEGIFITARHVVENKKILSIATTDKGYGLIKNTEKTCVNKPGEAKIIKGPYYHPNKDIDVAAIVTDKCDIQPIPTGIHLDAYIKRELMLEEVLIMGYPPIPCTKEASLIATTGRISGIVYKCIGDTEHPHFVLSSMARGGFSGGVAIRIGEEGEEFILGVITESLTKNNEPEALGYMTVLTIQPILECLGKNNILPQKIKNDWKNSADISWK